MKYPPTHAYPPVGGSHQYLFTQARSDIKSVFGKDVATEDVWFMPVPGGATAEAFRAGNEPVPYMIYFWDRSGDQPVLQYVPRLFIGDPSRAQRDRSAATALGFEQEKATRDFELHGNAVEWTRHYPRGPEETEAQYAKRTPYGDWLNYAESPAQTQSRAAKAPAPPRPIPGPRRGRDY